MTSVVGSFRKPVVLQDTCAEGAEQSGTAAADTAEDMQERMDRATAALEKQGIEAKDAYCVEVLDLLKGKILFPGIEITAIWVWRHYLP
ncbi:hypothetical protein I2485_14265 [Nesterenkonia sp. E16_7]|uniref:hypothetical protein n=1 Tax=unclassified Nesterenkonia TaxID=2629769 RepID=UPI001A922413|nr:MULTISPECIES: hypothetical protein [unclassified Nesterenkonia]MBO0595245.1 hypothetical protein [Nesterenkonia sp. E16_10]MBO0599810.1 hypothetical protein [Nesterenkonia sp. E16_7]